jgi:hypothetical protein
MNTGTKTTAANKIAIEEEWMNRPKPMLPMYDFSSTPESVNLLKGAVEVCLDSNCLTGTAELQLQFLPTPRLVFHANLQGKTSPPFIFAINDSVESSLSFNGQIIKGFYGYHSSDLSSDTWKLDWYPEFEPVTLSIMHTKNSVAAIFHLFNFPDFHGGQHQDTAPAACSLLVLASEEWKISIQALPDGATRDAWIRIKTEGGSFLTHMVKLERNDGKLFSGEEASEQSHLLDYFLSFVTGGRCSPSCGVGIDLAGEITWRTFNSPRTSTPPYSWFTPNIGSQAERLFPLFVKRWNQSDEWKKCLRAAIYWYVQANTRGRSPSIDASIILAQAALERLAHHYIMVDSQIISKTKFKNLKAAGRLRMLCTHFCIPGDITNAVPDIKSAVTRLKNKATWQDGPHAITDIRNSLTHPDNKFDLSDCYVDAWKLSLWYLELSVLALCDYDGTYTNRLTATYTFDSEVVPWKLKV